MPCSTVSVSSTDSQYIILYLRLTCSTLSVVYLLSIELEMEGKPESKVLWFSQNNGELVNSLPINDGQTFMERIHNVDQESQRGADKADDELFF